MTSLKVRKDGSTQPRSSNDDLSAPPLDTAEAVAIDETEHDRQMAVGRRILAKRRAVLSELAQ